MKPTADAGTDATAFPYTGPAELRPAVQLALQAVVDPEMAMSIVDVGLVYGVTINDRKLHAVVTMTSVACPVAEVILQDIESELDRALPSDMTIEVELVWEPAWTAARLSAKAKAFMGW